LFFGLLVALAGRAAPLGPPANPMAADIVARLRAAAHEHRDPADRKAVLHGAAWELPRGLYPAVLDQIVPIAPGGVDLDIARAIFMRWARETPDYAAKWALASPPEPFRDEAMGVAVRRWRQVDRKNADAWEQGLPARDRRRISEGGSGVSPL
jgi:hypothetical protein